MRGDYVRAIRSRDDLETAQFLEEASRLEAALERAAAARPRREVPEGDAPTLGVLAWIKADRDRRLALRVAIRGHEAEALACWLADYCLDRLPADATGLVNWDALAHDLKAFGLG